MDIFLVEFEKSFHRRKLSQTTTDGSSLHEMKQFFSEHPPLPFHFTFTCEARIWNGGKGGRCSRRCVPIHDPPTGCVQQLCSLHAITYPEPKVCRRCSRKNHVCTHKCAWECLGKITEKEPDIFCVHRRKKIYNTKSPLFSMKIPEKRLFEQLPQSQQQQENYDDENYSGTDVSIEF